jgi:hypothetical protein
VIFRVVDVNQEPLSGLFAVDLRFDAMGRHGRSVFARRSSKDPVEFRPRRLSIHVNRHAVRFKIARREHAAHNVLKDMLLDGIEAALFAQWIDKRNLGRVRPDLREEVQVNRVYGFGIPLYEVVDRLDVAGRSGILLGSNTCWDEESDSDKKDTDEHRCFILYKHRGPERERARGQGRRMHAVASLPINSAITQFPNMKPSNIPADLMPDIERTFLEAADRLGIVSQIIAPGNEIAIS